MANLLQSRAQEIPLQLTSDETFSLRARIASIETESLQIQTRIRLLQTQLDLKQKELAEMRNILAPIRKLPFEILSQIFYEYCFSQPGGPKRHARFKPQILISQVCSTFRIVAHTSPRLWTRLDISFGQKSFEITRHDAIVSSWLKRSGSLPLDLSLRYMDPYNVFLVPQHSLIRFAPFCDRLQSLTMALPLRYISSTLDQPSVQLPALVNLTLTFRLIREGILEPFLFKRLPTFLNAPRLESVKLKWGYLCDPTTLEGVLDIFPLPVHQIRSLNLDLHPDDSLNPRSYLDLLNDCSNTLVKCTLRFPAWISFYNAHFLSSIANMESRSRSGSITFRVLKYLSLEQCEDASESSFIQLITVPSLRTLRIDHSEYGGDDRSDISTHIIDLQLRSEAPLYAFELVRVRMMDAEDLLNVLTCFPTIKKLKLWNCNLNTKALMNGLVVSSPDSDVDAETPRRGRTRAVVPELEFLDLVDYEVIPKGCEESVWGMVESRCVPVQVASEEEEIFSLSGPGRCLRSLRLCYERHGMNDELINRLREVLDVHASCLPLSSVHPVPFTTLNVMPDNLAVNVSEESEDLCTARNLHEWIGMFDLTYGNHLIHDGQFQRFEQSGSRLPSFLCSHMTALDTDSGVFLDYLARQPFFGAIGSFMTLVDLRLWDPIWPGGPGAQNVAGLFQSNGTILREKSLEITIPLSNLPCLRRVTCPASFAYLFSEARYSALPFRGHEVFSDAPSANLRGIFVLRWGFANPAQRLGLGWSEKLQHWFPRLSFLKFSLYMRRLQDYNHGSDIESMPDFWVYKKGLRNILEDLVNTWLSVKTIEMVKFDMEDEFVNVAVPTKWLSNLMSRLDVKNKFPRLKWLSFVNVVYVVYYPASDEDSDEDDDEEDNNEGSTNYEEEGNSSENDD
ncbi:hypothetical protein D9757_006894 [Collybiopsis confluens]|uniref:F-box domain-containing protein n=1 Tax=Collybiopsis confluens TaxID=2823264 RepID=A0A8H5MAE8_9AGAR|nr:hypothetical protein D9757_006894 [Collybiopsis confluens]